MFMVRRGASSGGLHHGDDVNNSTATAPPAGRRRGRHAAPRSQPESATIWAPPRIASPTIRSSGAHVPTDDLTVKLPGMEILGFYDEPYGIRGERVTVPPRPVDSPLDARMRQSEPDHDASKPLIASLWEQIDLGEGILDWKPSVIMRSKLGGRTLSTTVIVTSLVLSALVSGVLWFALQRGPRMEAAVGSALERATTQVSDSVGELAEVSRSLGASDAPDLSAASAAILQAEDDARGLFTRAGELDEDDPRRATAVASAGTILDSASRASRLLAYRLAAEQVLVPPVLPSDPSATDLATATEEATAWRADVESSLEELPTATLGEHRELMGAWARGLESWQVTYLDAVREGDTVGMASAITSESAEIAKLHTDLLERLERAGDELGHELDEARSMLQRLLGA